jgi:predicted Zn-dependent protease
LTYKASFSPSPGTAYPATLIFSSVTISIRYNDHSGIGNDVYWLAESVTRKTDTTDYVLEYHQAGEKQQLRISDEATISEIQKTFRRFSFAGGKTKAFLHSTGAKVTVLLSVVLGILICAYMLVIPWFGEKLAGTVSKEWEIRLGDQLFNSMKLKIDTGKSMLINRFYKQIEMNASYPFRISVVNEDVVNAFAVPGGNIVVYEGLLRELESYEQLAALLAHETSHIRHRHSLRSLFRSVSQKIFLTMIVGNESGIAAYLAGRADDLKSLSYSRGLETEADEYGMQWMKEHQLNPAGMLGLMQRLQAASKEEEPSEFLSTHPVYRHRIARINEFLKKNAGQYQQDPALAKLFGQLKAKQPGTSATEGW